MTEPVLEGLCIARAEFARRLAAVNDWDAATPCGDWNVRQLVNHVVGQEYRFARSLSGGSLDEYVASRDDDFLGGDPVSAWRKGVRLLDQAVQRLDGLDSIIAWRLPMPAREILAARIFEATVHTWDLARAIGFDERLDERLVTITLRVFEWLAELPGFAEMFEAPSSLAEDAPLQARLLHLAGREP
jgi:uncharacterized protein (TIGR03086 family)